MKSLKPFALLLLVLSLSIVACKKKDDVQTTTTTVGTPKKSYEKKWNIVSAQRLAQANAVSMIAIEFNLNSYIIFYSGDSVRTGSFTEINAQTLQLGDYGTLTITSLSDNSFNFQITPTGASPITVTSNPAPVVAATSTNTTALCKTWKITKTTITPQDSNVVTYGGQFFVTFSQYGTYLTKEVGDDGIVVFGTNSWKWSDANETIFCFGKWDGTNVVTCSDTTQATITFLNDYKKFSLTGSYKVNNITYTETDELDVQ